MLICNIEIDIIIDTIQDVQQIVYGKQESKQPTTNHHHQHKETQLDVGNECRGYKTEKASLQLPLVMGEGDNKVAVHAC